MGVRKNVASLTPADVKNLQDAFTAMYDLHDDRGYAFYAGVHGLPLPAYCQHGTPGRGAPYFLPWHRAYLYFVERALTDALRRARGDASVVVTLPWWDWTSALSHQEGIPRPYLPAVGGEDNPLASGPVSLGDSDLHMVRDQLPGAITDDPAQTLRDPDVPDELPRASTLNRALRSTTFQDFSTIVEGIHNSVHGWVGGAMSAVPIAAYDPIFWTHHAMIDRIWYLWQLSPRGKNPPAAMLDRALAPWSMTVRQTLNISTLGYEYAAQVIG